MSTLSDIVKAELLSANVAASLADAIMQSEPLWSAIEEHLNAEVVQGGLYITLDEKDSPLAVFRFGEQGKDVHVPMKQLLADWDANDLYHEFQRDELVRMQRSCESVISWIRSFKVSVEAAIAMTDQDTKATPAPGP